MISLSILDQNLNDISYTDFLSAFGYGSKDIIYLRQFYDPERGDARKREVSFSSFDAILPALRDLESRKYGTFFCVNGGGQEDREVKTARAQFIDIDDCDFEEQIRRINAFPLEPSVIIKTKKSLHSYWLLLNGNIRRFRNIQSRLIQNFSSDPSIKNESRVMRLYGFLHQKGSPVMVTLIKFDPQLRYTQDQLDEVLPELIPDETGTDKLAGPLAIIPEGGRNDTLYRRACSLQRQGLPDRAIEAAIMEINKECCDPQLGEKEIKALVKSALQRDKGDLIPARRNELNLELTEKGQVKQTFKNALIVLREDPELSERFRFNELTQWPEFSELSFFKNSTGIVNDACLRAIREYTTFKHGLQSKDVIEQAVRRECERHVYNPAVDLFRGLLGTWDGVNRFPTYLNKYLGVDIEPYSEAVLMHTIYGVLNRTFRPGCTFDECLVLVGQDQGTGKSSLARMLALNDQWFWACKKLPLDLNKFYSNLQGCIVVELEEMAACRGVDIEVLRGIISEKADVFDLKYQNRDRYPRRNIFIGTTNNLDALPRDPAGNRRFLPVLVKPQYATARPYDPKEHRADTLQLYAQAMELYVNGDLPADLPADVRAVADQMREAFTPQDENQAALDAYVQQIYGHLSVRGALQERFSVLDTYNSVFNNGCSLRSMSTKDQRQMVNYLDHCRMLQRYSGSKNHKCRINGAVVVAWEFTPEMIERKRALEPSLMQESGS